MVRFPQLRPVFVENLLVSDLVLLALQIRELLRFFLCPQSADFLDHDNVFRLILAVRTH